MPMRDVLNTFDLLETRMLLASRLVLADVVDRLMVPLMQEMGPQDDGDSPGDWTSMPGPVQDLRDGDSVRLLYIDPLGELSTRDVNPSGEDLGVIFTAVATYGPQLTADLKRDVWK